MSVERHRRKLMENKMKLEEAQILYAGLDACPALFEDPAYSNLEVIVDAESMIASLKVRRKMAQKALRLLNEALPEFLKDLEGRGPYKPFSLQPAETREALTQATGLRALEDLETEVGEARLDLEHKVQSYTSSIGHFQKILRK